MKTGDSMCLSYLSALSLIDTWLTIHSYKKNQILFAMQEGISTIITAINRSRKIFRRIESYIIYRISCSMTLLIFFFFAIICMNFVMPTWVLILLSLTMDLSSMAISLDKVPPSPSSPSYFSSLLSSLM